MKLSVIIVNYNVKYFLEQCLYSVREAGRGMAVEVYVVDNNSVDGSCAMVKEKFPEVILIENKDNVGFSKANNQAIRISSGEYVLLLNPDTVVEADTFSKCTAFMDAHPQAGGLGVKMIDGEGKYLPESKRGIPTPDVAFYKISGLIKLFPKSKKYARYYLGHLSNEETCEIEILAGAFMLMRRSVLDQTGLLDETFFMYGEDIDLSYRIMQAGYKNYYFPETRIIHYKGESTKKGSLNYVYTFHNAMAIFARKHFSQKNAKIFTFCIQTAIFLQAFLSLIKRVSKNLFLPVLDFLVLWGGFAVIQHYWSQYFFNNTTYFPREYLHIAVPIYILIWLICVFFAGGYEKPVKPAKIEKGLLIGSLLILVIYSLLEPEYRYSRVMIILGSIWALISLVSIRWILHALKIKSFQIERSENKRFVIIGETEETIRVADLLRSSAVVPEFIGMVSTCKDDVIDNPNFIGNITQINEILRVYKIDEIIFCSKNISSGQIMQSMSELSLSKINFKIAPPESIFIIGSNSINTSDELYIHNISAINSPENRRNKRLFDIGISLLFLIISPVLLCIAKKRTHLFPNIFRTLVGNKTWVGYGGSGNLQNLPLLKPSVIHLTEGFQNNLLSDELIDKFNLLYARNYKVSTDLSLLLKEIRSVGN